MEKVMEKGRTRMQGMLVPTILMGSIALFLFGLAYFQGGGKHLEGLAGAWGMTKSILPLLFFAFIIAGFVPVLLPQDLVAKWLGAESGFKGLLIGSIAGGLSPGGPFVSMPVALGLLRAGASVGVMVAYLTGWSLLAVARVPIEVGILGWKFALIRFASTLIFPPLAGYIANLFFSGVKLDSG